MLASVAHQEDILHQVIMLQTHDIRKPLVFEVLCIAASNALYAFSACGKYAEDNCLQSSEAGRIQARSQITTSATRHAPRAEPSRHRNRDVPVGSCSDVINHLLFLP